MIINCPDGKTIQLKWAGRVGEWYVTLPGRDTLWQQTNDAGLNWLFPQHAEPKKHDPHEKIRCVRDYPWVCPHGAAFPCISKRKGDNKHLAALETTNWERQQGFEPHGKQLTLFEKGYWHNVNTGEKRWTNEERPYLQADIVCKEMAVASMEWLKRTQDWNPLKWRILPIDDDMDWTNNMQIKHSGRYASCVFDIWD